MKHTKENIIKVLEAKCTLAHAMVDHYRLNGDNQTAEEYLAEACALRDAIYLLEDKDYFNNTARRLLKEAK